MVSVIVPYLFYQPIDEKIKTRPLRFLAKENPNMEKTFIGLQYDVRLISIDFYKVLGHEVFSPECSINQSNHSISVRLLILFCSRVFISRSYENHFIDNYGFFLLGTGQCVSLSVSKR